MDVLASNTVFIVGAGASSAYGFAMGQGMYLEARMLTPGDWQRQFGATAAMGARMTEVLRDSLTESLDAILETRPDISDLGKLYISSSIAQMERNLAERSLDPATDWIALVFQEMCRDLTLTDFGANPVSFVTFNYDRLIEHRMLRGLISRYGAEASDEQCIEALKRIPVIHLHGDIGELPGFGNDALPVPFGYTVPNSTQMHDYLERGQKRILVVHEAKPETTQFAAALKLIEQADQIVTLGFAFGDTNVKRLKLATWAKKHVYGTNRMNPSRYDFQITQPCAEAGVHFQAIGSDCRDALENNLGIFRR